MSTAGISFGGLASGLDTKAIIGALVAIERRPILALEQKKTAYGKQKSLFGDLKGLLDKLTTAAKALKQTTDFLQRKATSDDEDIVTASAGSSATPGTYKLKVVQLAQAQVNRSTGSASPTAQFAATEAEFTITVGGNQHLITVNGTPTLQSIADAINAADDANATGVRADVVDTGDLTTPGQRYQLVVRSTTTGPEGAFSLEPSLPGAGTPFENLIEQIDSTFVTQPTQSELVVNGLTVRRSSNRISDLFPGVTLDLKSNAHPDQEVTITVGNDAEATTKKVQDFVDAYNKVVDFFTEQGALDAEGKPKSALFGDSTVRSMRSNLRSIVGGSVATGNQAFQMLSQLGITADTAGKLTLDQTKLEAALAADEDAAATVFTMTGTGIAGRLIDQIDVYTDSVDGLIKGRNDTFDRQVKDTQSRIDQAERRLTMYEKQLEAKYANLESLLSRLQSQGSSVGNIGSFGQFG